MAVLVLLPHRLCSCRSCLPSASLVPALPTGPEWLLVSLHHGCPTCQVLSGNGFAPFILWGDMNSRLAARWWPQT